jgi:hypothetical protein
VVLELGRTRTGGLEGRTTLLMVCRNTMKAVDPSGLPLVYLLRGCGRDGGGRRKWFSADKGPQGASGLIWLDARFTSLGVGNFSSA